MILRHGFNHTMLCNIVSLRRLLTKVQTQVIVYLQVQRWNSPNHQEPPQAHRLAQVALLGQVTVEERDLIRLISTDIAEGILLLLYKLWIVRHTVLRFDNRFLRRWVGLSQKPPHKLPLKPTQFKKPHFMSPLHSKMYRIIMGIALITTTILTTTTDSNHWVAGRGPGSTTLLQIAPPPKIPWMSGTATTP